MGISSAVERRASLENPSTSLANPAAWLVDLFGGGKTKAGTLVSEKNSLSISGVWAAVRLLASAVGMMPAITYRRIPGGKTRAPEQPAHRLLHERPNPEMTPLTFKATLQAHAVVWGGGFAEIEYDNAARPIALWPLLPHLTTVERRRGQKVYRVGVSEGHYEYLTSNRVMHVPGLSYDGILGYNRVRIARESLGLTRAAEEFGAAFFGNGSRLSGMLTTDGTLSDKQRANVTESWGRAHGGLSNAHRTALMEAGLKWQQIGINPDEAQFLETRRFQVTEVARWIGVPPHMIADLERSTYSNIESQGQEFVTYALGSWLAQWEQTASYDLVREDERGEYFVEFLREALMRGDSAARGQFYRELFHVGSISPNEIRERENLNPVEGGDIYLVPLNMAPAHMLDDILTPNAPAQARGMLLMGPDASRYARAAGARALPPVPETPDAGPAAQRERRSIDGRQKIQETFAPLLEEAGESVFAREINAATRALNKKSGQRGVPEFEAWLSEFYGDYPEFATKRFGATVRAMSEAIFGEVAVEMESEAAYQPEVAEFTDRYLRKMGERERNASLGQLRAILRDTPPEEVEEALRQRLAEWKEKRSKKFAAREAARVANAMARESYRALGVERLKWVATHPNCALCNKLNGRTVEITAPFVRKGETVDPEDGKTNPLTTKKIIRHPPIHQACSCSVAPA